MSDALFGPLYASPEVAAATDGRAWVRAMLDVEAALARAGAAVGLVPDGAARAIGECCAVDRFDVGDLGRRAVKSASPVVPLLADLRAAVPADAVPYLPLGATS